MDFDFTDDQESLRDAVRRWVDKAFTFERRHGLAKAGGRTRAVYVELAELGLTALAVPEAHGGMGFGPVEAMVVAEELGRGLVNAPYAQGALIAPALLAAAPAALQDKWLPKVADASALVVLAHQERASSRGRGDNAPRVPGVRARPAPRRRRPSAATCPAARPARRRAMPARSAHPAHTVR